MNFRNKTYKAWTILLVCAFIFSCSSKQVEEDDLYRTEFHTNKEGQKEGLLKRYNKENGDIEEETMYAGGKQHGKRKVYDQGVLYAIETWENDVLNGHYQSFHPNGQVKFEAVYQNGVLEGITKSYYPSGQLKEEVQFNDNEENGPFIEFHENGKIAAKGAYKDGDYEHGPLEIYDEDGILEKKMNCVEGVCRTTWKREEDN